MRLKIGDIDFTIKVADTPERRERGLQGISEIPKLHGLLLKWEKPEVVSITMENMTIPLGLVFISNDKVQNVLNAEPGQAGIGINKKSDMVLEANLEDVATISKNESVEFMSKKKEGGSIDYIEGDVPAEGQLHVLDDKGVVQGNLNGNERVFSRTHTKQLYNLASKCEGEGDFKKVGRAMVRMINKQDTQKQEYTDE